MVSAVDKVSVTVLVPIRNEEPNLKRCLDSVTWADEIVVVDSQSTDRSQEIAEQCGARVIQFHFSGNWPKKKNWSLDNIEFANEWVFILDADEVLPPEAEDEFRKVIADSSGNAGFLINRRFWFMGRWLKHAYFPNWNLRLFKHKSGRYERLTDCDTASGDNEVHEHLIVNGPVSRLESIMDHYAFPTVEIFIEKHNRYSNWEARVGRQYLADSGGKMSNMPQIHLRRRLKQLTFNSPLRPLFRFLYVYVWDKGFLDGVEGFYFACLHGIYEFLILAKMHELKIQSQSKSSNR